MTDRHGKGQATDTTRDHSQVEKLDVPANHRTIELDRPASHVAVVTLSRPPVNALNTEVRLELVETIDALNGENDVRAIVLTGAGRHFCAGADLNEKQTLGGSAVAHARANRVTRDGFLSILDSSKPVIAAVNGGAVGAGCVLAACCDMIVAADSAFFSMPEIDVGLAGGTSFLSRILPMSKVRRMVLTGERVPAEEWHRLGAVEVIAARDHLLPTAVELASTIASKSPTAVRAIKQSFSPVQALDVREGFLFEQNYTTTLTKSEDAAEARRAFLEKRKPNFG